MDSPVILCFDFDGTIADSITLEHASMIKTAQDFGRRDINDGNLEDYYGPTEPGILTTLLGEDEAMAAIPYFYRIYSELQESLLKRNEEILSLLKELKEDKNFRLFLLTGRSQETLEISLQYLGIESLFEKMYSGSLKGCRKAESMEELLEDTGYPKERVFYIGDTLSDIEQMKEAGVEILSVGYFHDEDENRALQEANEKGYCPDVSTLREKIYALR